MMSGFFNVSAHRPSVKPEDIPPPTEVQLPTWLPAPPDPSLSSPEQSEPLVPLLQSIHRLADLRPDHLAALRLHLTGSASLDELLPGQIDLPDFAAWNEFTVEDARQFDEATAPKMLRDGYNGPSCLAYVERRVELGCPNPAAFRSVRRLRPKPGRQLPRLGSSYDFFRSLEALTPFWDDPTNPPRPRNDPWPSPPPHSPVQPTTSSPSECQAGISLQRSSSGSSAATITAITTAGASTGIALNPIPHATSPCLESLPLGPILNPNEPDDASRTSSLLPTPMTPAKRSFTEGDSCGNEANRRLDRRGVEGKNFKSGKSIAAQHSIHNVDSDHGEDTGGAGKGGNRSTDEDGEDEDVDDEHYGANWRTQNAESMPLNHLRNLLTSFVKLVAYPYTCTVVPSRIEPRLQLTSPPAGPQRRSVIPSGCYFAYRTPSNRVAARSGVTEGPIAAISARNTTDFSSSDAQILDLARELVAALICGQHRAREGGTERRIGEGQWWATKPRYGGNSGGNSGGGDGGSKSVKSGTPAAPPSSPNYWPNLPSLLHSMHSIHSHRSHLERYPAVQSPSAVWDAKTRYRAFGRNRASDRDDVFVISCVLHHVSILRFSVPLSVLDKFEGSEATAATAVQPVLRAWRSDWFDLFVPEQRVAAYGILWAIMSYILRPVDDDGDATNPA